MYGIRKVAMNIKRPFADGSVGTEKRAQLKLNYRRYLLTVENILHKLSVEGGQILLLAQVLNSKLDVASPWTLSSLIGLRSFMLP